MGTINQVKQLAEADTPLLFFECVLPSSDAEQQRWCSHSIAFNGQQYSARVLKHNLFDLQLSADDAMDGISQLSLTLANADSMLSELNHEIGFRGAQLTVYFAFADLPSGTITTESTVLFRGIAGDPDEITEDTLRLTFSNKLSLQRVPVPDVRVQRTCPWSFPANSGQRIEAKDGSTYGRYSRFYRCGYSADVPGGVGNLTNGQAFTSCDGSRAQCQERGMFDKDNAGSATRRFGGFEFVPSTITVRTSGSKTSHLSPVLDNTALYNDPVPLVYGTGWLKAPVIFSRNDGDLTHMEVLLGLGTLQGPPQAPTVLKTVVNDIEIPLRVPGQDMTITGYYSVVAAGTREGNFNPDFSGGDPYGSMAVLSVVVPNRICSGRSFPTVEVLLQGIGLDTYNLDGTLATTNGPIYTNNPAWIILDILRRCGWTTRDLNLSAFASAATYCNELITTADLNDNTATVPRSQCNLILSTRQSAASVVRGIRVSAGLMLRYGSTGLLELVPETTMEKQQSTLTDGSNSTELLDGGWPAYEFSDGTGAFSGIIRNANGTSSVRMTSRGIAETSNRLSVEFQNEENEYQQDSLSLVDSGDSSLIGYEISSQSTALGIAKFNQATRILLRQLDKSTKGNQFIQFQTSFRALKVRPGDIITVTYAKEFLQRTPFRVIKLSPSVNYQTVTILAQIHDDNWYSDNPAVLAAAGRQPGSHSQVPRPLIGTVSKPNETTDFGVEATLQTLSDGTALQTLTVSFAQPAKPSPNSPHLPLVSLSSEYSMEAGGALIGGTSYYYAVSAVDAAGSEGAISSTIPVAVPQGMNAATLTGLSFPATAISFNVYRGLTPQLLYRVAAVELSQASSDSRGYLYKDVGLVPQPIGPPDPNFDHATFYYRGQYTPVYKATSVGQNTISNDSMNNVPSIYRNGKVVRIMSGAGMGQERSIVDNDATLFTVTPAWSVIPDATSSFAIVDSSWRFAAVSITSPVQFQIPFQPGASIQISGRAANVFNQEGSADLCPMTVWNVSGGKLDVSTPSTPVFTLTSPGAGSLAVSQVGFQTPATNIATVTSGTLEIFFWDEVSRPTTNFALPVLTTDNVISLAPGITLPVGQVIQSGTELMIIGQQINPATNSYSVDRASLSTATAAHNQSDPVFLLQTTNVVLPFERGFFENKASINYLHTVNMPDSRVLAAQMFMTNVFGDSQTITNSYTSAPLRTLSGGQFSLQVGGYLATQNNVAPPLLVQATHAVRDIWASVGQAAQGYSIDAFLLRNGMPYCNFTIPDRNQEKPVMYVDGASLPPLMDGDILTMNIDVNASQPGAGNPGRDLTVTIRF